MATQPLHPEAVTANSQASPADILAGPMFMCDRVDAYDLAVSRALAGFRAISRGDFLAIRLDSSREELLADAVDTAIFVHWIEQELGNAFDKANS